MLQSEMIGKVVMDYKHYTGQDLYSDGAVEDELLDIVINHKPEEFGAVIEEKPSWPVFYHLSELRGNIVEWMPIPLGAKVLEVGSGCGAITQALAAKGASLTCVELSKKRSLINANRNRDRDDITIHVGNFRDIEPELDRDFAFIFLIGVFEYGQNYIGSEHPFEHFLYMLQKHLAPGGRIVIAIENRLGLKYFAGCKEDHAGTYFTGIEGYKADDPARTFSRGTLSRVIRNAGISEFHFYYPYPDYKFMTTLHSDHYLPREGEFLENVRNYDRDRMVLFNEKYAYDALIRDRMYPDFANSFEVVIGPAFPTVYVKYSNDRADEFKIRTEIALDGLGRMQLHKYPLTLEARDHVRGLADAYTALADRYRGGDIAINDCQMDETGSTAIFSFVNGVTLSSMMDACIQRYDLAGFDNLFKEYLRRISYREDYPVADYDLVFSNILVNGPIWTVIDYEWTYGKRIVTRDIAFRALYCYVLEDNKRSVIDVNKYYEYLGLDEEHIKELMAEEAGFQKYVTGGRKSMVEIWQMLGFRQDRPTARGVVSTAGKDRVQIYLNRGRGFSEDDSYFADEVYDTEGKMRLMIRFEEGVESVRIDPAFTYCITTISGLEWNGSPLEDEIASKLIHPNGAWLSDDSIVFHTEDPGIEIRPKEAGLSGFASNNLVVELETVLIPEGIADNLYRYQVDSPEEEAQEEAAADNGPVVFGAASPKPFGVPVTAQTPVAKAPDQQGPQAAAPGIQPAVQQGPRTAAPGVQPAVQQGPQTAAPGTQPLVQQGPQTPAPETQPSGRTGTISVPASAGEDRPVSSATGTIPATPAPGVRVTVTPTVVSPTIPIRDVLPKPRVEDPEPASYDRVPPRTPGGNKLAEEISRARRQYYGDDGEDDTFEDDLYEERQSRRRNGGKGKGRPQKKKRREDTRYQDDAYDYDERDEAYDDAYDEPEDDYDYDDDEDFGTFEDFDDDDFDDDAGRGLFRFGRKRRR